MRPLQAIGLKLIAVTIFMVMAALIKAASNEVPAGQAVFFRSFFALPIVLGWLWQQGQLQTGLRTKNPLGHLWRGLLGTTAMLLGFASLGLLPLPEVTAIGFASSILTVIFAAIILGERIRFFRISAVGIGMIGVAIIAYPNLTAFDPGGTASLLAVGAMLALASATFRGFAVVTVRKLVRTETTSSVVFYFSCTSAFLGLLTLPFGWVWPSGEAAAFLVLAGLLGGVAQLVVTTAYRLAEMAVVAPFDYASMVMAVLIGWFIFGELPTVYTVIGSVLVIFAGLLIIYRERQLGIARSRAAQAIKQPLVQG